MKKKYRILIVDDERFNIKTLTEILHEDYKIMAAKNGDQALKAFEGDVLPDLILLDIMMPGIDGYEVCRRLKQDERTQHIPVIFVTMRDSKESVVEGFHAGGVDYITKPYEKEEVLLRVKTHIEVQRLTQQLAERNTQLEQHAAELSEANQKLQQEILLREQAETDVEQTRNALENVDARLTLISQQEASRWGIEGFVGKSETIRHILDDVRKLQHTENTGVLITGESGTGKELIARAIHFGGVRAKGPFIALNCSAIPRELAESTLFGHVRGAFTGATNHHKGYFELADGGTLFLDEIGDMPMELQPKLLRTLETGSMMPVGSMREKHVDVRVLAATNQELDAKLAAGAFRHDLYYRLARFTVNVPPLREHREDIPLLAEHFVRLFALEMGLGQPSLSREALSTLEKYSLPGNVRELKNIIEHALITNSGASIEPGHLNIPATDGLPTDPLAAQASPSDANERPTDFEYLKELVIKRACSQNADTDESGTAGSPVKMTHEEKILAYIEEHRSINNAECRRLLGIDFDQASYLLKKLHEYGLLTRRGERRWARYYLP